MRVSISFFNRTSLPDQLGKEVAGLCSDDQGMSLINRSAGLWLQHSQQHLLKINMERGMVQKHTSPVCWLQTLEPKSKYMAPLQHQLMTAIGASCQQDSGYASSR